MKRPGSGGIVSAPRRTLTLLRYSKRFSSSKRTSQQWNEKQFALPARQVVPGKRSERSSYPIAWWACERVRGGVRALFTRTRRPQVLSSPSLHAEDRNFVCARCGSAADRSFRRVSSSLPHTDLVERPRPPPLV